MDWRKNQQKSTMQPVANKRGLQRPTAFRKHFMAASAHLSRYPIFNLFSVDGVQPTRLHRIKLSVGWDLVTSQSSSTVKFLLCKVAVAFQVRLHHFTGLLPFRYMGLDGGAMTHELSRCKLKKRPWIWNFL